MERKRIRQSLLVFSVCLLIGLGLFALTSSDSADSVRIAQADISGKAESAVSGSASSGSGSGTPSVYMTTDISSRGLVKVYEVLDRRLPGKIAVKLHTGEPGGHHFLSPDLIKDLVKSLNGTIVESNTGYPGRRASTAMHKQVVIDHGFTAVAPVDILDEEGELILPVSNGKHLKENYVGSHYSDYDSFLVLTHFKGHAMGGFGGSIKNMSIGIASAEGKLWIHSAGIEKKDFRKAFRTEQDSFLEAMAEAAGSVAESMGDNIIYINVMNNLSVDCDCDSSPEPPAMADIGILASLDPVALDKACVDLVYKAADGGDLIERMESRNGIHTLDYAAEIGLGSLEYKLVSVDN